MIVDSHWKYQIKCFPFNGKKQHFPIKSSPLRKPRLSFPPREWRENWRKPKRAHPILTILPGESIMLLQQQTVHSAEDHRIQKWKQPPL